MGKGTTRGRSVGFQSATSAIWRACLTDVVSLLTALLHPGDVKQTFRGNAAFCGRPLHLVAARKNPLVGCASARPVCADFSARERLDHLGTEIPRARGGFRLGPNLPGTSYHRWSGHLVLPWKAALAASADLHLSALGC